VFTLQAKLVGEVVPAREGLRLLLVEGVVVILKSRRGCSSKRRIKTPVMFLTDAQLAESERLFQQEKD